MSEEWRRVAAFVEVPVDGTLQCWVGEHAICLYHIAGTIYATDDACTHGDASLADGFIVNDKEIECSYHQGRFDIATGKATHSPCSADLRIYPVKVVNADVLILFDADTASA